MSRLRRRLQPCHAVPSEENQTNRMLQETKQLVIDLLCPGIDLTEALIAYSKYRDHVDAHPEEAVAVLVALDDARDPSDPVLEAELIEQAEQLTRERDQLDRECAENVIDQGPSPVKFASAKAPEVNVPKQTVYLEDITPDQADLLQEGKEMNLGFGKFGPKGAKGFKTIYEIWLEEPAYLDWVYTNVERLTPLQKLVIGLYSRYVDRPSCRVSTSTFPGSKPVMSNSSDE